MLQTLAVPGSCAQLHALWGAMHAVRMQAIMALQVRLQHRSWPRERSAATEQVHQRASAETVPQHGGRDELQRGRGAERQAHEEGLQQVAQPLLLHLQLHHAIDARLHPQPRE